MKVLKITLRVFKWVFLTVFGLVLLISIALMLPPVQKLAVKQATGWFNSKTQGELSIEEVDIRLPFYINLGGVALKNPEGETLVAFDQLALSIGWRMIFDRTLRLDRLELAGFDGTIKSDKTGTWNFDFIIEAFLDPTNAPSDTSSSTPFDLSIGSVAITDFRAVYHDVLRGDSISTSIASLSTSTKRFSLAQMVFLMNDLNFKGSQTFVKLGNAAPASAGETENDSKTKQPTIDINSVRLEDHVVSYKTASDSLSMHLTLGRLEIDCRSLDLESGRYALNEVGLYDTDFVMESVASENPDTSDFDYDIFIPLNLLVDELSLANNQVSIHTKYRGKPESELILSGIGADIGGLDIDPDGYSLNLRSLRGSYNGIKMAEQLRFGLELKRKSTSISDLLLQFGKSKLSGAAAISYPSLKSLVKNQKLSSGQVRIDALLVTPEDLMRVYTLAGIPDSSQFALPENLSAAISASLRDSVLDLNRLNLKMAQSSLELSATGRGPELSEMSIDLNEFSALVHVEDFRALLPDSIDLSPYPKVLELTATGKAAPYKVSLDAQLASNIGDLGVQMNTGGWKSEHCDILGTLYSEGLDLSDALAQDSLWTEFSIKLDLKDVASPQRHGDIDLAVYEINYGKYALCDTRAKVSLDGEQYEFELQVNDSNARGTINGSATLGDIAIVSGQGDIRGIDFQYLELTEKDYRTQLSFAFGGTFGDTILQASLDIKDAIVVREGERLDFKPVSVNVALLPDSSGVKIESEWFNLKGASNLDVIEIAAHMQGLVKESDDIPLRKDGYLEVNLTTGTADFIEQLVPKLRTFASSRASISYNAATKRINASASFPEIRYDLMGLDSLTLDLQGSSGEVAGALQINRISYDTLAIEGIEMRLTPADVGTNLAFKIFNGSDSIQYNLEANLQYLGAKERANWIIDPVDRFVLAGKKWDIGTDAMITIRDSTYGIEDFDLRRKENLLSLHSPLYDPTLHIKAKNFNLDYISSLFTSETSIVAGLMNLDMDINNDGTFEGKADIKDLAVFGTDFGRFDLSADADGTRYELNAQVEGSSVDLEARGSLESFSDNEASVDVDIFLTRFNVGSLSKLFPDYVKESRGIATGKLDITGTTISPVVSGRLNFKDISVRMVNNEARYTLRDEKIELSPERIVFPSFVIRDSAGSKMVIDGEIQHSYFRDQRYDLTIKSDNFTLLDILPGDDPFIYGRLIVGTDIAIRGDQRLPVIRSDVRLKDGSEVVIQIPEEEYDDMSFAGLVEWVSFDEEQRRANAIINAEKNAPKTAVDNGNQGINLSGQLRIDPQTKLKIVIDPLAGDNLEITGGGTLGMGYDKSGQLSLSGTYRVTGGSYEMTFYNIVKRSFVIEQGSTIMWNGDPYNPEMNITAIYKTRIPLASLMGAQGAEASANESLRRPADFELHMNLTGDLDNTEVGFEIKLAPESKGALSGAADARVAQINESETELNRQVFAMLVLNTFVNDAAPSGGSDALANEARNSASQILTNQLNSLSDKFIGGAVDLNFDMLSYQGADGGAETDLNIDVSKTLFNDRVMIKVGSTVALEGSKNNPGAAGNELITNIVIEYRISPDGRYNFKVFRKEDLDDILVGRLTRTGVGVMFRREFDTNEDLFKLTEEEKKLKEEKEAEENSNEGK